MNRESNLFLKFCQFSAQDVMSHAAELIGTVIHFQAHAIKLLLVVPTAMVSTIVADFNTTRAFHIFLNSTVACVC